MPRVGGACERIGAREGKGEVSDVMKQIEARSKTPGMSESRLGEVFEYAGMLAAAAARHSDASLDRQEGIRRRLIDLAACAVAVFVRGDGSAGLASADEWLDCAHDVAARRFADGVWVRAAHWPEGQAIRSAGSCDIVTKESCLDPRAMAQELLHNQRLDGSQPRWLVPNIDEECPF